MSAVTFTLEASKSVAVDSPDHLMPHGTKNDNSRNARFNRKFEALFGRAALRVLDMGCSGGGFVKDCLDGGHWAVGLEGSDLSLKARRAEWATIPQNLFTCDVTADFRLREQQPSGEVADARFDLITAWELIEHIRPEDLPAVCENVKRHLAAGGLWVMSVSPNEEVVNGVRLHQTVEQQPWWVEFFASQGLVHHPELVAYFNPDWIRGPLQNAPRSFHLILGRAGDAVHVAPARAAALPRTGAPPIAMPTADKLLSLVIPARNDAYMGDFKWRFGTCLNYLAANLEALGRLDNVEVVVGDWNSDVPIHEALKLTPAARRLARFVVVPPDVAGPAQGDSPFPIPIVQNVAIRRCRGQYVAQTDSDILFTRPTLSLLLSLLDGKLPLHVSARESLLVASRRHLPYRRIAYQPTIAQLDDYLCRNASLLETEAFYPGFATPSGMCLMHRQMWEQTQGYDERLVYWGWMEIDLYLRVTQRHPWVDLANYGVNLLHMEHYKELQQRVRQPRKMNPMAVPVAYVANDEYWGLADRTFAEREAVALAHGESAAGSADACAGPAEEGITAEQIGQEVGQEGVRKLVEQFATKFRVEQRDLNTLFALAWFGGRRYVRTFVDVGVRRGYTAGLVAATSPGVEIFGVDSFLPDDRGDAPPAHVSANAITAAGHKGYTRFVGGGAATAVDRLLAGGGEVPFALDLALVRTHATYGDAVANATRLAGRLSAGGAIVISSGTPAEFAAVWQALGRRLAGWTFVQFDDGPTTGLLLKPSVAVAAAAPEPAAVPPPSELPTVLPVPVPAENQPHVEARAARRHLANAWLVVPLHRLPAAWAGDLGLECQGVLASGIGEEKSTAEESAFAGVLAGILNEGATEPAFLPAFFAAVLYRRADQLPLPVDLQFVPDTLLEPYLKFILAQPQFFREPGEIEAYCAYLSRWVAYLHGLVFSRGLTHQVTPERRRKVALLFAQHARFIPLYFTYANIKDAHARRAELLEFAVKIMGHGVDHEPHARPAARRKIRVGVLAADFNPQTETFHTLPTFEYLDRSKFEVFCYALQSNGHALEQYVASRADRFVTLGGDLPQRARAIRADDLDVLLIGTNVGAVTNDVAILALHRLARAQVTVFSSPASTGMRNMDYFLSGELTELADAQSHYREKLVKVEGPGFCFGYRAYSQPPTIRPTRRDWGVAADATLFVSGANYYKIVPETIDLWARVVAAVPGSALVLYPFGPAWSSSYVSGPFLQNLYARFAAVGVEASRLVVLPSLAGRADVLECVKLCDVYLDSPRHAGGHSLVDPLEVGVPAVSIEGEFLRSRHGAAILRDLNLPGLVAKDEADLERLAVEIGRDAAALSQWKWRVKEAMGRSPRFLDSQWFGGQMEKVYARLAAGERSVAA